jgi:hypothetical protein
MNCKTHRPAAEGASHAKSIAGAAQGSLGVPPALSYEHVLAWCQFISPPSLVAAPPAGAAEDAAQ